MNEKIIGFVYRFGSNDYQITLADFSKKDQQILQELFIKYADTYNSTSERGDKNLSLNDCNIDWFDRKEI